MLEKILGYNPTQSKQNLHQTAVIDLAAVTFHPSHFLWYAQLAVYIAMLVFSLVALLPFLFTQYYLLLLWVTFVAAVGFTACKSYRKKNAAPIRFEIIKNEWWLIKNQQTYSVSLAGEVLLWSWVIIIPVQEKLIRKKHYLIALPDSLSREEWRRLCVWLKTCLH